MSPTVSIPGEVDIPWLVALFSGVLDITGVTRPSAGALGPVTSDHFQQVEPGGDGAPRIGPNSLPTPSGIESLREGSLPHAARRL
eukprot:1265647-Alexandrium_andersonii.AAC.1